MNLSLAITTYNRYEFTIESFAQVIDDPRIDDIVILDDCSTDGSYEKLVKHFAGNEKVRVIRQAKNRGMGQNKRDAISYARNEWVIILDSDNVIGQDYIDSITITDFETASIKDIKGTILCPEFAKPKFDYRQYTYGGSDKLYRSGMYGYREAKVEIKEDAFYCLLNTCNYVVHRDTYLKVYEPNTAMKGTDTIWFNYLWLKAGYSFYVVPGMQYFHRVHNGSGFLKDIGYNMKQAEKIKKIIMAL